jgi:BMFP domain-containing protein YqiC
MALDFPRVEENTSRIFEDVFADANGDSIFATRFSEEAVLELVEQLSETEEPSSVQLLASKDVLKQLRDDFGVASSAAELVAADTLNLRTMSNHSGNQLLITEDQLLSFVHAGSQTGCTAIDDGEFVTAARKEYSGLWDDAEEFSLRTPPYSRISETLTEEFGADLEADFQAMVDALDATHNDEFDEVAAVLLAAAKHEELLYDISKWGEDVGLASKATLSRKKNRLEEVGLVETEKVPIDVGRPRLRLLLDSSRFSGSDTSPDTIVSVGQQRLSVEA